MTKIKYSGKAYHFEVRFQVDTAQEKIIKQLALFENEYHALVFAQTLAEKRNFYPRVIIDSDYLAVFSAPNDPYTKITVSRPGFGIPESTEDQIERKR